MLTVKTIIGFVLPALAMVQACLCAEAIPHAPDWVRSSDLRDMLEQVLMKDIAIRFDDVDCARRFSHCKVRVVWCDYDRAVGEGPRWEGARRYPWVRRQCKHSCQLL